MKKKRLSRKVVMKIWYKSLCLGYKKHSDLYDVRKTVIKAAKKTHCRNSDVKKIKECFDKANIKGTNCNETYESYFKLLDEQSNNSSLVEDTVQIIGKVVEADRDFDYSNNKDIQNAVIKSLEHDVVGHADENGNYSINHEEDNPIGLSFSKNGYIGENLYVPQVNAAKQDKYYTDLVELIPNSEAGMGKASGYIRDSVTGKGIEHLKIEIRRGINNIYTDVLYEIDSQENGYYITPQLEAGNYCMEIYDNENGYISTYFNIKIFGNGIYADQNMTISNSLEKNQMRAVLTWGAKPRDLDAHLSYSLSNGSNGHVYYGNKMNSIDGICVSKLDVDDRNGFGPETTTIYNDKTGEHTYYVKNYSKEMEMKEGGNILVKVYFGNENVPAYTFSMPYSPGKIWTVFRYNSSTGRISAINEVGDKVK